MAINFPNSPVAGSTYTYLNVTYIYRKVGYNEGYWAVTTPATASVATADDINQGTDNAKYVTPLGLDSSEIVRQDKTTKETTLYYDGNTRIKATNNGVEITGTLLVNGNPVT